MGFVLPGCYSTSLVPVYTDFRVTSPEMQFRFVRALFVRWILHIHGGNLTCSLCHNSLEQKRGEEVMLSQSYLLTFCLLLSLARLHSVCISVASLSLSRRLFPSCTHIFSCDSFFQFSLVLLLPCLSPYLFFPLFFPSLSFSPAPLLSPSERLRIPKGADAIKMLILSVYRERERGGLTA